MEWWQSLLMALIPSTLTASITLTVALVQIRRAKTEIEAKRESDRKQHVSRMRLDMEFAIYKELFEKVIELVSNCIVMFRDIEIKNAYSPKEIAEFQKIINEVSNLYNEANISIHKYAIFIPDRWYNEFTKLKTLCLDHLEAFKNYVIFGNPESKQKEGIEAEVRDRGIEIANILNALIVDLREYLSKLGAEKD